MADFKLSEEARTVNRVVDELTSYFLGTGMCPDTLTLPRHQYVAIWQNADSNGGAVHVYKAERAGMRISTPGGSVEIYPESKAVT